MAAGPSGRATETPPILGAEWKLKMLRGAASGSQKGCAFWGATCRHLDGEPTGYTPGKSPSPFLFIFRARTDFGGKNDGLSRLLQSGRLQKEQLRPHAFEAAAKPAVPARRVGLPGGGGGTARVCPHPAPSCGLRAATGALRGARSRAALPAVRMDAPFPALTGLPVGLSTRQRSRPPGHPAVRSRRSQPRRDLQLPAHGVRPAEKKLL